MDQIEVLKHRMDAIAGTQQAMAVVLNLTLSPYRGNQQVAAAVEKAFEQQRSSLLASSSSDYMIRGFDEIAETLLEVLRSPA